MPPKAKTPSKGAKKAVKPVTKGKRYSVVAWAL
jgi:hypothetical protein